MKKLKIVFSLFLAIAMMCSISIPAFAAEPESDMVITSSYNPYPSTTPSNDRSIIGDDNRIVVTNTSSSPYAAIGYMEMTYSCGCGARGSGFMVSKNCMLTAAHCMICEEHGNDASSVTVYFGYKSSTNYLVKVTATPSNSVFYHNPNYTGSQKNYDYGYIVFNTNVGNTTGWFGLASRSDSTLDGMDVNVTGYRRGVLYDCAGEITSVASARIKYDADTEAGQSGCPVYFNDSTYGNLVVAIHTNGTDLLNWKNSGWRITSAFINELADLGYVTKVS